MPPIHPTDSTAGCAARAMAAPRGGSDVGAADAPASLLSSTRRRLPGLGVAFGLVDDAGELRVLASDAPAPTLDHTDLRADLTASPRYLAQLRRGHLFRAPDVASDERLRGIRDSLGRAGIGAIMVLPLMHEERLVGVACLNAADPHVWTASELEALAEVGERLEPIAAVASLSEANGRLSRELQRLRRNHRDLSATALGIAHDIRNLLLVVFTSVESGPSQVSRERGRARLQSAARQIEALTQRLFGQARGEGPAIEAVAVAAALDDLRPAIEAMAGPDGQLTIDVAPNVGSVATSRAELVQLVTNLAVNAFDVMGDGGRLEISASREGAAITLSVADAGPGIDAEVRDHLFESGVSSHGANRGIGLAVVHDLVRRHGGRIEFASEATGTTFHVTLPGAP